MPKQTRFFNNPFPLLSPNLSPNPLFPSSFLFPLPLPPSPPSSLSLLGYILMLSAGTAHVPNFEHDGRPVYESFSSALYLINHVLPDIDQKRVVIETRFDCCYCCSFFIFFFVIIVLPPFEHSLTAYSHHPLTIITIFYPSFTIFITIFYHPYHHLLSLLSSITIFMTL